MRIRYKMRGVFFMLCTAGLVMTAGAGQASESDSSAFQRYLDSLGISRADLDAKVLSTLMFGGSSPVSFSGEGRFKIQYHQFSDYPKFLSEDKSYVQSNWEGNESAVRLGMVARAGRNTVLYSKIGFQNTLPGNYVNSKVDVGNKKVPKVRRQLRAGMIKWGRLQLSMRIWGQVWLFAPYLHRFGSEWVP